MRPSTPGWILRFVRGAAIAMSPGLLSCSLVLDWSGYTGGAIRDGGQDSAGDGGDGAAPPCTQGTCGGCCDSQGFCARGQLAATCGTGGETCQDCARQSLVCNAGSCQPPAPDAAPPPACNLVTCGKILSCLTNLQSSCCKPDGSCGCINLLGGATGCN